jgi:hypothetical protein
MDRAYEGKVMKQSSQSKYQSDSSRRRVMKDDVES